MNRLLGRPSVIKATLCSLALHAGTIAAAHYWWSKPVKQVSFAGHRQTVFLEATFSEHQPEEVEVHLEADPEPIVERTEYEPDHPSPTTFQIAPHELPRAKSDAAVQIHRPVQHEIEEVVDVGELIAQVTASTRRPREPVDVDMKPAPSPSKVPRYSAELPTPQSTVAVTQIAGVEDKEPPDFSGNRPPSYPVEAIRRRLEGTVVLRLHIADTGRVDRVEISESSGHTILDHVAVDAVSKWRGRPAQQSGHAVATVELLPVRFRLRR